MVLTPHPRADLLNDIAAGRQLQWLNPETNKWKLIDSDVDPVELLIRGLKIRRPVGLVNGVEVEAGIQFEPPVETKYWIPAPCSTDNEFASRFTWQDDELDKRWLERGIVYLTQEAAEARALAMMRITIE